MLNKVKFKELEGEIMATLKRLMNGEWYTSKLSATQLIPSCYPIMSPNNQTELLNMFARVSVDEIPQVRKTAAIVLNDMIKLIPKVPETELLNVFAKLNKDEQDAVRMQGVESCVVFAKQLHSPVSPP